MFHGGHGAGEASRLVSQWLGSESNREPLQALEQESDMDGWAFCAAVRQPLDKAMLRIGGDGLGDQKASLQVGEAAHAQGLTLT